MKGYNKNSAETMGCVQWFPPCLFGLVVENFIFEIGEMGWNVVGKTVGMGSQTQKSNVSFV